MKPNSQWIPRSQLKSGLSSGQFSSNEYNLDSLPNLTEIMNIKPRFIMN